MMAAIAMLAMVLALLVIDVAAHELPRHIIQSAPLWPAIALGIEIAMSLTVGIAALVAQVGAVALSLQAAYARW